MGYLINIVNIFILSNNHVFSYEYMPYSPPLYQPRYVPVPSIFDRNNPDFMSGFGQRSLFHIPSPDTEEEQIERPVPVLHHFQPFPPFPPFPTFPPFPPFPPFSRTFTSNPKCKTTPEPRPKCRKMLSNLGIVRYSPIPGYLGREKAPENDWHITADSIESSAEYVYEYDLPKPMQGQKVSQTDSMTVTEPDVKTSVSTNDKSTAYSTSTKASVMTTPKTEMPETTKGIPVKPQEVIEDRGTTQPQFNISEYMSKNIDEEKLFKLLTHIFEKRSDFLKGLMSTSTEKMTSFMTTEKTSTSTTRFSTVTDGSTEETTVMPAMPPLEPESIKGQVPSFPSETPTSLGPFKQDEISDNIIE